MAWKTVARRPSNQPCGARVPASPVPMTSDDRARGPDLVERGQEHVVLLGGADGDADALAGERPGDDRPGLECGGQSGGLLPHGQPDEVRLAVGDVEPTLA